MPKPRTQRLLIPLFVVAFVCAIIVYNSIRPGGRHQLLRRALLHPSFSPWKRLLNHGDEGSFIEMTGFNFQSFRELITLIGTEDELHRVRGRGRPKLLGIEDEVGLYLFFTNSTLRAKHLSLLFGILPSTVSTTIKAMMSRVIQALKRNEHARIKFPNEDEMARFAELIHNREPMIEDVIAFLDGVSMKVECSDEPQLQADNYNGYQADTCVNNIFLFSPEGKVIYAVYNAPGSWHDSHVAEPLIAVVLESIGIYKICVDQGFPRTGELYNIFVGPMSARRRRALAPALRAILLELHNKYVSLRQGSEWGMRSLQGAFARLKSRLTSNARVRGMIIRSILLLHNFRTAYVGLNQITEVFSPHYEQIINIDGYDRIRRYYDNELNYVD